MKSKGLTEESIRPQAASDNCVSPTLNYIKTKIWVKCDRSYLKQDELTFNHKTEGNTYILYKINLWPFKQKADFMLGNYFFGAVKLTKNADFDKYNYSGCGIGFDAHASFLLCDGSGFGKNVIIFGADMSSSAHVDNGKKDIQFVMTVQHKG